MDDSVDDAPVGWLPSLVLPRHWQVRTDLGRHVLLHARAPDDDPTLRGATLTLLRRVPGGPADPVGDRPSVLEDEEEFGGPGHPGIHRRWSLRGWREDLVREEWEWALAPALLLRATAGDHVWQHAHRHFDQVARSVHFIRLGEPVGVRSAARPGSGWSA